MAPAGLRVRRALHPLKVKTRRHDETGEQEKQKWSEESLTRPLRHCTADATAAHEKQQQQRQPFHFVG